MDYKEAKARKQQLEEKNNRNSKLLNSFGKSNLGLTPDYVRELPEWQEAKENYDSSFAELRNFNVWFVKTFKKEYAADRRKRNGSTNFQFCRYL